MTGGPTIAVLGANGFIGNRIVETLHRQGRTVRPVVRRASGLAMASRFPIEGRVADGRDAASLVSAFAGCDVVVHALAGDPRTITGSIIPVYRAAVQAGCRRIVYMSSAMVHGQAPTEGCDENSPLPPDQALAYNRAKRRAERLLFALAAKGPVEVTALRPGIVYGPRSQWIGGLADALLEKRAGLVDGGRGLCNAIHVDNLVHAANLAAASAEAAGEAFLIGEEETPDWRTFYRRVAQPLGIAIEDVPTIAFTSRTPSFKERIDVLRQSAPVRNTLARLPAPLREGLAAAWGAARLIPEPAPSGPVADLETALLHQARYVPAWRKARERLGYAPILSSAEAWRATIAWLGFAGYPVVSE